ncbi:MAG TPA: GIY-YIG nuclease family protein [Candidatus Saccharimonadales bacterium]|nr:GIY-YIG nuclease family protein [Candidatus Saccharimonadales bacterium]
MYYAYILRLKDKTYYHGSSDDLKERIKTHKYGLVESTKNLRPFKIIYYAAFETKTFGFEKYLKTSSGFAFRNKRLIENN